MKYFIITLFFLNAFNSLGQIEDTIQRNIVKEILKSMPKENLNKYVNDYLPEFSLTDLEGNFINSETLKGKPTVLNFWFTNCAPCIKEIPTLNEIKKEYNNTVNFIAITYEKSNEIKSFLKLREFDFQHLVNSEKYLEQFGVFGYPKSIILDNEFKVVKIEGSIKTSYNGKLNPKSEFKNSISTCLNKLLNINE